MNFLRKIFGDKSESETQSPVTLVPDIETTGAGAAPQVGSTPSTPHAPAELEEQSELLISSAPVLMQGVEIPAPDGAIFDIEKFLETRGAIHVYAASRKIENENSQTENSQTENSVEKPLRLRETHSDSAHLLEREFQARGAGEAGSTPGPMQLFQMGDATFLADEFPPTAPTLAELFAEGAPPETTLPIILRAAKNAREMHARGWMHGGLRPEVISSAPGGNLMDFSSARPIGQRFDTPISHGEFSATELAQADATADARADVFSLGALLYRALAGVSLGEIQNNEEIQRRVFSISGVPQILTRALGEPPTRFQNAGEFYETLARWASRRASLWEYSSAVVSVIGLNPTRTANEDAALFLSGGAHSEWGQTRWAIIAVADGMGGMDAGEAASRAAIYSLAKSAAPLAVLDELPDENLQAQWTNDWAQTAAREVAGEMKKENARGGCTLVFVLAFGNRITLAHAGDCRAYIFSSENESWEILTRDHSYVATLWQAGEIAWEELRTHPERNQITRALGEKEIVPDWFYDSLETSTGQISREISPGEVLLLASDGVWEPVLENEMSQMIRRHFPDLSAAANAILDLALERGAPDNATIALLTVNGEFPEYS